MGAPLTLILSPKGRGDAEGSTLNTQLSTGNVQGGRQGGRPARASQKRGYTGRGGNAALRLVGFIVLRLTLYFIRIYCGADVGAFFDKRGGCHNRWG